MGDAVIPTMDDIDRAMGDGDLVLDLRDDVVATEPLPAPPGTGAPPERQRRRLDLLVWVLALNLLDAALTAIALDLGVAREANPVIAAIGLPVKVVAVSVVAAGLWWLRPGRLIVPVAAYGAAVTYTLVGLLRVV